MLVSEVGVGCNQDLEGVPLRRIQQIAILQFRPAALVGGGNFVMRQGVRQGRGSALIKKYAHLCGSKRASRGVIKHGPYLFKRNAGKPFNELRYESTVLEIFEQR